MLRPYGGYGLLLWVVQDGVTIGGIGAEGAAAGGGLRVLVGLAEIPDGIGEVDSKVVTGFAERIPGIDAIRAAVDRAA